MYHLRTEGSMTAMRTTTTSGITWSSLKVTIDVRDMVRPSAVPQTVMNSRITVARAAFLHPEGLLEERPNSPIRERKKSAISTK